MNPEETLLYQIGNKLDQIATTLARIDARDEERAAKIKRALDSTFADVEPEPQRLIEATPDQEYDVRIIEGAPKIYQKFNGKGFHGQPNHQ